MASKVRAPTKPCGCGRPETKRQVAEAATKGEEAATTTVEQCGELEARLAMMSRC